MSTATDFSVVNYISLSSITDSKITNINLYTSRAQITRSYKVSVAAGQTKLTLLHLPNVVDHESLRVEGRGSAIIQGVTSFKAEMKDPDTSSPLLEELNVKKERAKNALERCNRALQAINKYMGNISIEHLDISKLGEAMEIYDTTEEKWDDKIIQLKREFETLETQITEESDRLEKSGENKKLRTKVVMGLVANHPADLEIIVIYAVSHSRWEAGYDIRVDMQTTGAPVHVLYKAAINQSTGEAWEDAPITLETASPTFGLELPQLALWNISYQERAIYSGRGLGRGGAKRHRKIIRSEDDEDFDPDEVSEVTSRGNVNATFRVPGLTTIPSDEEDHNVTIAVLQLNAKISWVCIPQRDTQVHLEALITNSSEYTFLSGPSNVYVDQSFISRSEIPGVSPGEVFTCPLGVDPSIRVTYHPQEKVASQTGFYNKSLKYAYSQRISVHNSKSVPIDGVKIIDRIPVSQDADLIVNLINPGLTPPSLSPASSATKAKTIVTVSPDIIAQWCGVENPGSDVSALGKDGKLNWVCGVPAYGRINLLLQWEVIDAQKKQIYDYGL
ncbi:Protein F37C4.5 [Psilocybe cubensis]|uniref:Protein F37C4.5 n=2 Tax=Psilocybe cubensis TaxID=181762 RepID=A0ACB8GHV3_PSICU|nr:Protein F37C4.5 [Psilocybe cubensis]KAH9475079.1 Protein F37C4.5 [Psilocybe cubensis]